MGSVDRHAADLECTPIFASMCEQLGIHGALTATGDTDGRPGRDTADLSTNGGGCDDGGYSDCGHRSGSLDLAVEDEQARHSD
jgi:hypothetical protein